MDNEDLKLTHLSRRQLLGYSAAALLPQQLTLNPSVFWMSEAKKKGQQQGKPKTFGFPSIGMKVNGEAVLFAIDNYLLPLRENVCYYLSKPKVRKEPVLAPSQDKPTAPDYASADLYGTVLRDEGKYRMWYLGGNRGPSKPNEFGAAYICYAESEDGIRWSKPDLGQVLIGGSRNNNAIAIPDPETEGVTLIKDDEDPDPKLRYKLAYQRYHNKRYWTIRTATSPNGIDQWRFSDQLPIAHFVEFSSLYKHNGMYILNAQTISPYWRSEGGHALGRQGVAWLSTDFNHWLQEAAESFFLPEPANPQDRGGGKRYDQVHLGVGAASFGNVLVGLYCNWHARGAPGDGLGFGATSGDFGLVVSHDGLHFREPVKGWIYLASEESPAKPAKYGDFPTILEQNNSIMNVDDETRIYHGRWLNMKSPSDWYGEIALATLPRDRWGALGLFPDQSEGSIWSAPMTLPSGGCQIAINAEDALGMRVEISDDRFNLIPAYSGLDSGEVQTRQGMECRVKWKENLLRLSNKTIRLRFHLKKHDQSPNPRLYAVYLR